MTSADVRLMAHLMRRVGFGVSRDELDSMVDRGYESTVEHLLSTDNPDTMPVDLMYRYNPENSGMISHLGGGTRWMYRMISTDVPLVEKIALFWHGIFATGYSKLCNGKPLDDQIRMFGDHGLGNFRTLLLNLSRDPAMMVWLDNYENHKGAINENYGRELLELFSMGVGNYSEHDIKEAARAFTGWTIGNTDYMVMRAMYDQDRPYGRIALHFEYRPEDHDDEEKEFLGCKGRLNGEDIIDIICRQPATARFISRHLYSFFVADEPPVPEWPYKSPRDPEAIETLSKAYFDSGYEIREMLRVLFNSDFFKSPDVWYERVKSPAELMAGVLKFTDQFRVPRQTFISTQMLSTFMGQTLLNPNTVEGWHWGTEWIDSGTLIERVNFASREMGNLDAPGVIAAVDEVLSEIDGTTTPESLVEIALDRLMLYGISNGTQSSLNEFVREQDQLTNENGSDGENPQERVAKVFSMIGASPEFQQG